MMRKGLIDKVIVGADRITKDAVFNKIGTYTHSVLAKEHNLPFYVAAPLSTFDPTRLERDVTIEERDPDELRRIHDVMLAPADAAVYKRSMQRLWGTLLLLSLKAGSCIPMNPNRGMTSFLRFLLCISDRLPCIGR